MNLWLVLQKVLFFSEVTPISRPERVIMCNLLDGWMVMDGIEADAFVRHEGAVCDLNNEDTLAKKNRIGISEGGPTPLKHCIYLQHTVQ